MRELSFPHSQPGISDALTQSSDDNRNSTDVSDGTENRQLTDGKTSDWFGKTTWWTQRAVGIDLGYLFPGAQTDLALVACT